MRYSQDTIRAFYAEWLRRETLYTLRPTAANRAAYLKAKAAYQRVAH